MQDSAIVNGTDTQGPFNARYVWMISTVAALGGLLFGYDWVVIGGAKPFYEAYFGLTTEELIGWANSCALLGCLIGSLISGAISDRIGRKKLLIVSAFLFAISSVSTGWASTFSAFVTWRIIGGVAIGIASNVSPTYIAEISPAPWRGRLVALNQVTLVLGILIAQVANWLIAESVANNATPAMIRHSWNGQFGWRWMFTAVAVPAVIFFLSALFVPESPRWLVNNRREAAARRILARIGGERYAAAALQHIENTINPALSVSVSRWRDLFGRGMRRALCIGIVLAVLQQWSGINIIFNYAEEVYRSAGYNISGILFNIVITGTINVICTLIALGFVDKVGRRPLLLIGCAGVGISHFFIGLAYHYRFFGLPLLILTLCAIGCYAMSLAPITWIIISEIFPNRIRGMAVSISVSALWIASFALTYTFPIINHAIGPSGSFWLYAGICFCGLLFAWREVPETKGKTLESIEEELVRRTAYQPRPQKVRTR